VKFDEHNNIVGPVYVTEVQKRADGGYWNVPTETIADVSQFWNLSPEDYMKAPVFSRDHTGNEG
jgi:branched-chain amino acid transport system substrate-binding protein